MKTFMYSQITPLIVVFLFICSGFGAQLNGQDRVEHPEGELQPTSADDIWPQTMSGSNYNEFWTYHFYLENELEITLIFSIANFGSLKSPVSGARASILGFGGDDYQVLREYPLDRLVTDKDRYQMKLRRDRDIWIEGKLPDKHSVHFVTTKDGVSYDIRLEMKNIQQGYKWGNGIFSVDGSRVGIVTHIPYADVSGTVKINDREKKVSGSAYMDHIFQDKITTRLFSDGFRFVYHNGPDNWEAGHFLGRDRRDERNIIGYTLVRNNNNTSLKKPRRLIRSDSERVFGHDLPKKLEIEFTDGSKRSVERVRDRERFEMLQELGRLARRVARGYLRGEVIEFRGEARFVNNSSDVPVRYNYFIVD